jgi:hypothetical protein
MRYLAAFGSIIIACLLVTSCNEAMQGNGILKKESRTVPPFESLRLEGGYKVMVTCQKEQGVQIECDENILPHIITEIKGKTLYVHSDTNISPKHDPSVTITIPNLTEIVNEGSVSAEILNINNASFAIESEGSAIVTASGQAANLQVKGEGSCIINAKELEAENVRISIEGSGQAKVKATKSIDAKIEGSGTIEYFGDPSTVNQKVDGSGNIIKSKL